MNVDIERLRSDLVDYFGSAISIFPMAIVDVICVENANDDKLIEIAINNGFNLDNYIIQTYTKNLIK